MKSKNGKMNLDYQPSILVRLVHSIPHINATLNCVNSTFDPKSVIYKEVSKEYASNKKYIVLSSLTEMLYQ